ncbi:MAG TPA: hypothetical protein VFN78_07700 [Ktedonobacterales bacterium]|nr:hypothetical protein [Ktedonobacterales bacterium]
MSGADAGDDLNLVSRLDDAHIPVDVAVAAWSSAPGRSRPSGPLNPPVARQAEQAPGAFARLRALGETALAVGAALGQSEGDLAASEGFDRVERFVTFSVEQAVALRPPDARQWFAALDDDLEVDLTLEGLDATFDPVSAELRVGDDPAGALATFQEQAQSIAEPQGDSVSVSARLRIGKRQAQRLAEQALDARRTRLAGGAPLAPEAALVFYSAAACERMLTLRAAAEWERRGLGGAQTRLCLVICDSAGNLAGVALEVIGAASAASAASAETPDWLPVSRTAWRRFAERAAEARRLRDAESAWSGLTLALMPGHLRVAARLPGLDHLATRLQTLRAEVAACALASHVECAASPDGQGDLALRFAGTRPAVVWLRSGAPSLDLAESEPRPRDALIDLTDWAYRDASPDKLAIARQALADTISAGTSLTLAQLCVATEPALDAARANLAIYLRGATERYFQLRAAAQQAVSGFADATRAAVASLTSDVTDNLYRTVGLIVGVVIAWLIQPSASLGLVRIATALYTVYVVFILLYLLRARRARFHLERTGLDDTLAAMPELTPAERDRLRKPAGDAEAHFERFYRLTRAIYLGLAAVGALLFALLLTPLAQAIIPHVPR